MAREKRFTFLCSDDERRVIASLASNLQRSQSDAVRWLIVQAAGELTDAGAGDRMVPRPIGEVQDAART